jgi:hypothetical protein
MSEDVRKDMLKRLEKDIEERKEKYAQFKGMIQGLRLTNLSPTDKDLLLIVESMGENFKSFGDNINYIIQFNILLIERVNILEKEVSQLRHSMDTLNENR